MEQMTKLENILLLSTSLLVDRVFLHTELVNRLSEIGNVKVWASSINDDANSGLWSDVKAEIQPFPKVSPFKEFPYNFLRRFDEYVWDCRLRTPSRLSMQSHVRDKQRSFAVRALKLPAKLYSLVGSEHWLEAKIEDLLLAYPPRCAEGMRRLQFDRPSIVVSTGLFQFDQPAVFEAAKRLNIPTLAYVPSWDNITTKNRMIYKYDGYIVWSEKTKEELNEFYPSSRDVPVYVVGAPQFDVFFRDEYEQTREEFCKDQGLDPKLPIVVYAVGSPNFLKEQNGAIEFAKMLGDGKLGQLQILVRPHPIHDNGEMRKALEPYSPLVKLQETPNQGKKLMSRSQDEEQIREWVNTFRYASVVVNLSSTVTVDAAICDTPVVNLDFDPDPSKNDHELIKDINHRWNHFSPIAQSGGVWLVNDYEELAEAVIAYIKNPNLHREERKWIVKYVCGYADGKCGERMAIAIGKFLASNRESNRRLDNVGIASS